MHTNLLLHQSHLVRGMLITGLKYYMIFYGDFERPLRRRFREVFAKFSRSFSEKTAPKKIWK